MEHNLLQILAASDMEKQHELSERVEDIIYELKNLAADNDEEQEDMDMSEKSLPLDDDKSGEQEEFLEYPDLLEDNLPQISAEEDLDLGVVDDAQTPAVAEGKNDVDLRGVAVDGLMKNEGCEGHQAGEQWGSSNNTNCMCGGADRLCYRVDCLPGSDIEPDSNGLWKCKVDLNKRYITDSSDEQAEVDMLQNNIQRMLTGEKAALDLKALDDSNENQAEGGILENSLKQISAESIPVLHDGEKRFEITSAIAASATGFEKAFDAITEIFGTVGFIMDHIESAQTAQLNEIQDQTRELNRKVGELTRSVSDLQLGQQYLRQQILYVVDEHRLSNMLDTLASMQTRYGKYVGSDIQVWADSVLSPASDRIRQVLFDLLNMVKPQSEVFGGRSLFEIYRLQLEGNLKRYTVKMPQLVAQVYGLIGGGYTVWTAALRIKGRTNDIPAKVREGQEKLKDVEQSLQNYVTYGDSQKITFPTSRSTSNYARMWSEFPRDLSSFTLCLHMRSPGNSNKYMGLVSYAVRGHDNEILVFKDNANRLRIWVDGKRVYTSPLPVWDGAWHILCTTWRSYNGAWQVYVDGKRMGSGSGLSKGGKVSTGGTWILGQDQDTVGGGFDASQAFIGDLSQVNLWNRMLSSAEIRKQWPKPCEHHGNVIDWTTTLIVMGGQVARGAHSYCQRDLQKMTFPTSRSTSNYVKLWSTLPRALSNFTLCLHMRSPRNSHTKMGLVSYAVGSHDNEILLYKDDANRLQIWVDDKMAKTSPLPVLGGTWHVLCATWRSTNGAWQFYFDGVLRNSGSGLSTGGRVGTGGTWILGQDQDTVGGGFDASQAFIGDLSQVNLWNRVLSSAEMNDQSASCDRHGNVIDWADTFFDKRGKVTSSAYSPCKQ
ncbi:uncharacterized protein LOC144859143 [Branchiostoma floridae x Branchiostoma japonicum]